MIRLIIFVVVLSLPTVVLGQELQFSDILPEGEATFSGRVIQGIVLLTVLSIAPGLLIACTCFLRFIVALSFLRAGLGLQATPPNLVLIALALFMTFFVMQPVFQRSWEEGVQPLIDDRLSQEEGISRAVEPVREFMLRNVRPSDISVFESLSANPEAAASTDAPPDLSLIVPAFMLSELRRGFEIGLLILLPFLIIDLAVAAITMSMGMMMLPPTVISLPFKVLFFVLIDGWRIIIGELLQSVSS